MFDHLYFPHSYLSKRNHHSLWYGYDSEEQWHKNLQDSRGRTLLEKSGWWPEPKTIHYDYNHHGFRDEPLDDRAAGMALGCSFTEGIGVAANQTWPAKLTKRMGIKVWNMGIGGTGIDTCFRIMEFWAPVLRPKFIVMLDPPIARLEICRADGGFTSLLNIGWEHSDATSPQDRFIRHWFAQERNWITHHRRHVLAMRQLATDLGIPFVHLYHGPICQPDPQYQRRPDLFDADTGEILDRARDLAHAGPQTLDRIAGIIYEMLREVIPL